MKNKLFVLFVIGITFRIIMGLQGFDHVDLGFCNTFYQLFWSSPDSNTFNFIYYLLGFVGSIWEHYMGQFGVIGFRILEAFTLAGAIFMLCLTYRHLLKKELLMLAAALSFVFPTIVVTFHYNTFSFFLIALSAYCFISSIRSDNAFWIVASGIAIGLSYFVRLVNFTLVALLLCPFLYYYKTDVNKAISRVGFMLLGVLVAILMMLVLMIALHQEQYYLAALNEAFLTFVGNEATHSHTELMVRYFRSYINVLIQIPIILLLGLICVKSYSIRHPHIRNSMLCILFIGFGVFSYTSLPYLTALSAGVILVAMYFYFHPVFDEGSIMCIYLLLVSLVYPFGSDIGIQGVFHWCAGLLIFPSIWCAGKLNFLNIRTALFGAYLGIMLSAIIRMSVQAYGEVENRSLCFSRIEPGRLNVLTTSKRAERYRKAITAINNHLRGRRLMFVVNQASELYYATKSLPFEGHVQPIVYKGELLKWRLEERLKHFEGELPLIAFIHEENMEPEMEEIQKNTFRWMEQFDYHRVYDDGFISLYETDE